MSGRKPASREQQQRAVEDRSNQVMDWSNPQLLDTKHIPARPGYVQRWVRTAVKGQDDQSNVFRKINQGWRPRSISDIERGQFIPHVDFNGADVIGIHGMILMERPEKQHKAHAEHNRMTTANQMRAVEENLFKVHDSSSGLKMRGFTENKSEVRKGRIAPVDDD